MLDRKEYEKQYREKNKNKINEYAKQYRATHEKEIKEVCNKYYKKNRERLIKYMKQYYKDNSEKARKRGNKWANNNREKVRKHGKLNMRKYRKENRNIINQGQRNRCKIDLKFNLNRKVSCLIWQSLKGNKKGRKWESLVGFSCENLTKRLKMTMPKGYTWQDFLKGKLHIDHIIPISAFHFSKSEHTDFKRCWALKNLQLLPARENLSKGARLSRPFQPALRI